MGLLRVILALAIVAGHAQGTIFGLRLMGGVVSVQTFFIISGFYMALILDQKYTGKGAFKLFISNRFLRLFPIYWTVLALTAAVFFIAGATACHALSGVLYPADFSLLRALPLMFVLFANLFIFGQGTAVFMGLSDAGSLYFTTNFRLSHPRVYMFQFVPQAWTLEIEMLFYLMAPWLVRKRVVFLCAVLFASAALRAYIYRFLGLTNDPWTYRFFPTELALFVLGILAHRIYKHLKRKNISRKICTYIFLAFIEITLLFEFVPGGMAKSAVYYLIAFLAIPPIFIFSERSRLDRYIGELSYPIYISHFFITFLLKPTLERLNIGWWGGTITAAVVIAFSMLLMKFVGAPVEAWRQRRAERHAGAG